MTKNKFKLLVNDNLLLNISNLETLSDTKMWRKYSK